MATPFSTLKEGSNLGALSDSPLSRINQVGRTNRDDFYRFKVGNHSQLDLKLSQIAKGANVDVELYALKRSWSQVVRRIGNLDFRKVSAVARSTNLQWMGSSMQNRNSNESITGDLAPGEYCVRVLQRSGNSRYQLSLKSTAIASSIPVDPVPVPVPNPNPKPPSRPPASGNGYSLTGTDEAKINAQFNLFSTASNGSLIPDEAKDDLNVGLFTGGVENFVSGHGRLRSINASEIVEPFVPDPKESGISFAVLNLRAELVYDKVQQKRMLEYTIFQENVKNFRPGTDKAVFGVRYDLDSLIIPQLSKLDLDQSVNSLDYIVKNNLLGVPSGGAAFSDYPPLKEDINNSAIGVAGGAVLTSQSTTLS